MNEFYGFENLECWKQAKDLAVDIYRLQDEGNFSDDYGLLNDLRQSATSVASFIASGRERGGASDFIRYLSKAKSMAALLRTQLIISRDVGYLAEGDYLDFEDKINRITAMVGGLIKAIRNKSRGSGADTGSASSKGLVRGSGRGTGTSKGSGISPDKGSIPSPDSRPVASTASKTAAKSKTAARSSTRSEEGSNTKTALRP